MGALHCKDLVRPARRTLIAVLCCLLGSLVVVPLGLANHKPDHQLYPELSEAATSSHFVVHFTGDLASPHHITRQEADTLANNAEQAYAVLVEGDVAFAHPVGDQDGRTDIYVLQQVSKKPSVNGVTKRNYVARERETSSGYILVNVGKVTSQRLIAHEFFHVLQMAITTANRGFASEATAHWAAAQVTKQMPTTPIFGKLPMDCFGQDRCAQGDEDADYKQWAFFQSLSDRFGPTIVRDIFIELSTRASELHKRYGQKATLRNAEALAAIDTVLQRQGSSLSREFGSYIRSGALGSFTLPDINNFMYHLDKQARIKRRIRTNRYEFNDKRVIVDHLSKKVVRLKVQREYGAAFTRACARHKRPTLKVTVRYSSYVTTRPMVYQPRVRQALVTVSQVVARDGAHKSLIAGRLRCSSGTRAGRIVSTDQPQVVLVNDNASANSQVFHVYAQIRYPL